MLMPIRFISQSWAQSTSRSWKILFRRLDVLTAITLISASRAQKHLISYFPDLVYVAFMKNFDFADWNKLTDIRDIPASWSWKYLIRTL